MAAIQFSPNQRSSTPATSDDENSSLLLETQSFSPPTQVSSQDLQKARYYLYFSHLFATGSERAWQFCLVLFLAAFSNYKSLVLVSTYGLSSGLAVCILGGKAGKFVDHNPRLFVARCFIQLQNGSVLLATWLCYELLSLSTVTWIGMNDTEENWGWLQTHFYGVPTSTYSIFLLIGIHIFGSLADVFDKGLTVAIERDWVVVMSEVAGDIEMKPKDDDPDDIKVDDDEKNSKEEMIKKWLAETNVFMRQIDLTCKVVAPVLAGFFVAAYGSQNTIQDDSQASVHKLRGTAILIGALNASSLLVEYCCTMKIYNMIPGLSIKKNSNKEICKENHELREISNISKDRHCYFKMSPGLALYLEQSVSLGGLSLALLYINMLSFGQLMTAYLVWRGMRIDVIGVWRGISAVIGLFGTTAFSFSVSRISLEATGLWSIAFQFTCLTLSYASLFVHDYNTSLGMLIVGVCASRIGLWVFDISITQIMQIGVPEKFRGVVGGVQHALNAFCALLAFGIGILYPDPSQFFILVGVGYLGVGTAMILYACWFYKLSDSGVVWV